MIVNSSDDLLEMLLSRQQEPEVHPYPTSRGELRTPELLREYCLGGRGVLTLENPETGKHHTYEFRRPNNPEDFVSDTLFIYVLVKGQVWLYVGMFNHHTNTFKLTRSSKFSPDSEIVRGAKYIVNKISGRLHHVERMRFFHEGICSVCGRKLTTVQSIERGIGPRCLKVLESRK